MDLNRKIDFAIKLLRSIPQDGPIEVCYSGGKDSDVILELAKMSGIPFEAIYKNTTIDPPGTIAHCREKGVTIWQPRKSFLDIVRQKGMPSRFGRFCCSELKEYKIHDRAILGIRREESTKRAATYKEPEICRVYKKGEKVRQYFPILEWTAEDVAQFIRDRGLQLAPCYYDEKGEFQVERRLGCLGCPLASDNGAGDYKKYPKLFYQVAKAANDYLKSHPHTKAYEATGGSVYNYIYRRIFTRGRDYEEKMDGGLFPELERDTKGFLEGFFGISLDF